MQQLGSKRTRGIGSDQDKTVPEDKTAVGMKKDRGQGSSWDKKQTRELCSSRRMKEFRQQLEWEG